MTTPTTRLNSWQAIWLVLLIQLIAVVTVVSSQPIRFPWLSWRDLPGIFLLAFAFALQLATSSLDHTTSSSGHRWLKMMFVLPLLTWMGLWGHQSLIAQIVGGILIFFLGVSLWTPESHPLSFNRFLRPILEPFQGFIKNRIALQRATNADAGGHEFEAQRNETSEIWHQTWKRQRDEAGDVITGRATFEFPAGQKTAWYHLPIWPLMPQPPSVQLKEPVGQVTGKVRATQVETYGVRLELKLNRTSDRDERLLVDFRLEADGIASGKKQPS
jgi:hypothetical protein